MKTAPVRVTAFQQRVYEATLQIPRGRVTTYAELARYLDCASAQAVGQALKRNPFAPRVPCHRVVRSDGSLGGFNGATEGPDIARKIQLLKKEGVRLNREGCVEPEMVVGMGTAGGKQT